MAYKLQTRAFSFKLESLPEDYDKFSSLSTMHTVLPVELKLKTGRTYDHCVPVTMT